jgi:hypothetical protein
LTFIKVFVIILIAMSRTQGTVAAKTANRKAAEQQFEALAAFANLGDTAEDWKRFRLQWPNFFPEHLTDWMYKSALEWNKYADEVKAEAKPTLLWYRDCLRSVWSRNDAEGINLKILLGFEKDVSRFQRSLVRPLIVPGQPANPDKQTISGMPEGKPVVNGLTGQIEWHFGSQLQQSIYDLMQHRWRAMVCPICGKFHVASKTAQKYCSPECYAEFKRRDSLRRFHERVKPQREAARRKAARREH